MHPILFHLGHLAIPTQGVLVAVGLVAGLQLSCSLARRLALDPDRIWNLGLTTLATYLLSQRLLVIAFNLRDFLAHPFWMLGLTTLRDERYTYADALLALLAAATYTAAWQLPWRRVADALGPGAGLALTCISLGQLAAGESFGRQTLPGRGIVYTSPVAARVAGTPLDVRLLPLPLYEATLYMVAAAAALWLFRRQNCDSQSGRAAAGFLFIAGLGTVLLDGLRYPAINELLLFNAYTPAQALGIAAVVLGGLLLLLPARARAPLIDAR